MSIAEQALRASVAGGYRTLQDIGSDFGVTRERIRQLCKKYDLKRSKRDLDTYGHNYQMALAPRARWPREGIPTLKRRLGLCQRNGCVSERAPGRVSCPHHLRLINANSRRYYADHRAAT